MSYFTKREWTLRTVCSAKEAGHKRANSDSHLRGWGWLLGQGLLETGWKDRTEIESGKCKVPRMGGYSTMRTYLLLQSCAFRHGYNLLCTFYHIKVWIHCNKVIPNSLVFFYITLVNCRREIFHGYLPRIYPRIWQLSLYAGNEDLTLMGGSKPVE